MADSSALIDELSRRLRDPNNTRHSRALVNTVLTQCQRVVNLHFADVVVSASFTPTSGRTLYRTSEIAANVARIAAVRQEDRDLHEVPWPSLVHSDARWYRRIGPRHELFARIGGSLFALYPAVAVPAAVSIDYVSVPADLADTTGDVVIDTELLPLLLDLGELVLTAKNRDFVRGADLAPRVQQAFGVS
jgi:hypothetical protein